MHVLLKFYILFLFVVVILDWCVEMLNDFQEIRKFSFSEDQDLVNSLLLIEKHVYYNILLKYGS